MADGLKRQLRIPPQNLEAEKALLGSIMLKPEALYEILDLITPGAFYADKHKIIYEGMLELFGKHTPIDLLSLSTRLKEKNVLESIGGISSLAELVETVPTASNAQYYADMVQKKSLMRNLIEAAEHISELGYAEAEDIEEILDRAEKRIFAVTNFSSSKTFIELKDALGEAWERLDKLHKSKNELRGVPTGFKELDTLLAGFQKSDLIILAARPSMGKTSLALDIARQAAVLHNIPVGIFSLEMSSQQLVDRMLAAEAKINSWNLRTGRLNGDEDFDKIRDALDKLSRAPIFIDDQPGNNILKMRSVARRLKSDKGLGLVVVDYLQLMAPTATRSSDSMVQQVTEISRSLKHLARELDVPVLALSQLSRAVEQRGGKPRLSDLRDSGCLSGDTLITRADTGEQVTIQSMVGQKNISVLSLGADKKMHTQKISKVFSSGIKETFELKTQSGRTIKASANHQFLTIKGWKRLDELKEKTHIALPRTIPIMGSRTGMSDDELLLLAHLLGDGCIIPHQPFHYTSEDKENIKIVQDAARRLFSITSRIVKQKNWFHLYLPSPYRLARSRRHPISLWYEKLNIKLSRSYEKILPEKLFSLSNDKIKLFLHHLWATDGNISYKKIKGRRTSGAIYYSTTSEKLAGGIQHLLLRCSILSTLRKVPQGKYRPSFQVHIQGSIMQKRFCEEVGCFGSRGKIIPDLIDALKQIIPNTNLDVIPEQAWRTLIEPAMQDQGLSWRKLAHKMDISYNGTALVMNGIGRERLSRIAEAVASRNLGYLAESDIYWDHVVSIKPLGPQEVFDATVPGTHNFLANDILVHNSIEQDADVVMFIHREDKYKEDSDRPNIAEILVEKHRNGPTGKVELYFDEKKTTFLSLEKSDFSDFAPAAEASF